MFHKLCWKMTAVFAVMLSVVITAVGGFMIAGTVNQYHRSFFEGIDASISSGLGSSAQSILGSGQRDTAKNAELDNLLNTYAARLGLSDDRHCYILSVNGANVIAPSTYAGETLQTTPNIQTAIQKHIAGEKVSQFSDYIDYAAYLRALDEEDGYILYVRDNQTALETLTRSMWLWLLEALGAGLALSLLLGFLLSRPIIIPVNRLTKRVENFAKGEFDVGTETVPQDEIGRLIKTFNTMGSLMNESLNQMTAEKHKIEVILEHITNGIMAFNTNQKLIHINSAAKQMLKIADDQRLRFDDFFESLDAGVCMAEFLYLEKFKTEIRDLNVGNGHIRVYFVPFKMDNEKTAGVVCVLEDFTEQFDLEAVRQKFVAEVSHELKTPLTTIKTYTETLLNGYLDDKKTATSFLTTIEKETDKMTSLVSNLLTLSRFDVKKFEMKKEPFSLEDMLRSLVKTFSLEAEIEDIDLIFNKTTDIPQIYADKDQIERALKNIISNAIKYGEPGGHVRIYAGNLYNEVYVKVEDDGKGIPKTELEHVFERFYRVDKARTREKGGTGLGLSIAKEIIENHGGTIKIESEYGRYTRVTINLPMAA